jgi:hypothetical protein
MMIVMMVPIRPVQRVMEGELLLIDGDEAKMFGQTSIESKASGVVAINRERYRKQVHYII